jgi:ABC-type transport system involved in cytochrome c biogenesis permease component
MRLFSEEKRTGTLEVLLVAPVSDATVVLGKFLGAWAFFLVAWGIWFVFPLIFRFLMGQPFDYRPLLSFYVGTAFLVMSFIGLGVFFSAITDNQVIAAVLSYAGVLAMFVPQLMHWQFSWASRGTGEWLAKVVQQIAILEQYESLLQGQLYLQHLLYHVSIAAFFLFLTVRVLESRKWK